jgi:inner membrane protein YidH
MAGRIPSDRPHLVGDEPDARFSFANERTFLAWTRVAMALVAGSLAASQLVDFDSELARLVTTLAPLAVALWLPVASYRRWQRNERALRMNEPLPRSSLPRVLALSTTGIALLVGVVVALAEPR